MVGPMNSKARTGIRIVVLAGLVAGLAATAGSAVRGWSMGGWSDASRQWVVCQYVRARINPYELAQRLLRDTFGPATGPDRVRLKERRIYSVSSAHWTAETPGLLPGHPPPEATYPPSTLSMLMVTIGFLPERWLLPVFTSANLAVLAVLLWQLGVWFRRETGVSRWPALAATAALVLLWPPVQQVIRNGQTGVLSLLCAWLAVRRHDRTPVTSGLWFLAAMIKPSMALLYLLIPLVKGHWKPIWTALAGGLVLTVLPAFWLGEWPWTLLMQWMDLCRYVLQGAYTIQEVLNAAGWENTWVGTGAVLAIWGAAGIWCGIHRRADRVSLFALLSFANLAWTYHERHDFVLLVVPVIWFVRHAVWPPRRGWAWAGLVLCGVLGLALADPFYIPSASWAHAVRWAGRLAIPGLWAAAAIGVRQSHWAGAVGFAGGTEGAYEIRGGHE